MSSSVTARPNSQPSMPRGIIVPAITPLRTDGAIDWPACERVLAHVMDGGVDAVFTLGTNGEGPSLNLAQQGDMIKFTCEQTRGRCPVYVGVTHTSLSESLHLAELAGEAGAAAAVIAPSPYFPAGTSEQVAYFRAFVERSAVPTILYNIPQMTKTALSLGAFVELIPDRRIIAVKDSSGQMAYFRRLQHLAAQRPDFATLIGADELLAEAILLGAHGGVTGGANIAPRLFQQLFQAALRHDLPEVARLQSSVMELSCELYAFENGGYTIAGIKASLAHLGLCEPWMAQPLQVASAGLRKVAASAVAKLSAAGHTKSFAHATNPA